MIMVGIPTPRPTARAIISPFDRPCEVSVEAAALQLADSRIAQKVVAQLYPWGLQACGNKSFQLWLGRKLRPELGSSKLGQDI